MDVNKRILSGTHPDKIEAWEDETPIRPVQPRRLGKQSQPKKRGKPDGEYKPPE